MQDKKKVGKNTHLLFFTYYIIYKRKSKYFVQYPSRMRNELILQYC